MIKLLKNKKVLLATAAIVATVKFVADKMRIRRNEGELMERAERKRIFDAARGTGNKVDQGRRKKTNNKSGGEKKREREKN